MPFSSLLYPLALNLQPLHPRLQPLNWRLHLLHQYLHSFLRLGTRLVTELGTKLGTNWGHYHRHFYRHYLLHSLRIIPIHDGSKESSETTAISPGTHSHKFLDKPSGKDEHGNIHTIEIKRVFSLLT